MTAADVVAAQDGTDISKWNTFLRDHVAFVSNAVLTQMIKDLNDERDDRITEIIGDEK